MLNDIKIIDDIYEFAELKELCDHSEESPMYYKQGTDASLSGIKQTRFSNFFCHFASTLTVAHL